MDYTKLPRELVYKDHNSLEEIYNANELNAILIENMQDIEKVTKSGFEKSAISIFNTAYYICTMIMLDENPSWRLEEYKNAAILDRSFYKYQFQAVILSVVTIFLKHYNKEWRNKHDKFIKKLESFLRCDNKSFCITSVDCSSIDDREIREIYNCIENGTNIDFVIPDKEFAPRSLEDEEIINTEIEFHTDYVISAVKKLPNRESKINVINNIMKRFPKTDYVRDLTCDVARAKFEDLLEEVLAEPVETTQPSETGSNMSNDYNKEEKKHDKLSQQEMTENQSYHLYNKIQELEDENKRLKDKLSQLQEMENVVAELEVLKTENQELKKQIDELHKLYECDESYQELTGEEDFTVREKVAFFSTAMSVAVSKNEIILRNFAKFLEAMCKGEVKNVGPMFSRMNKPDEAKSNAKAAKKVADMMSMIVPVQNRKDPKLRINVLIESIKLNYPDPEEE